MDLYTLKHVTLFSTTHSKEQFLKTIETWAEILESAPEGLQGWWYSRDLGFHILQKSLLNGALESCLISLVAAFVALVVFTPNFAASLLATASILLSVVCIVACMVGFGWTLNLAEAIILSLGIGVSIAKFILRKVFPPFPITALVNLAIGFCLSSH